MMLKTVERKKPVALIIDDDVSMRISMQAALAKVGFEVKEADNGLLGIDLFKQEKPDLVLLDVIMPGMDGFATCQVIRSIPEGRYAQILMVTGLNDTESTEKAFEAGANGFINKPINWTMLGHRGKYMLRAGRAFQELEKSKNRLAKTQEMAKLGNWEIDLTTNEFDCSPEARLLLKIEDHVNSMSFSDFFSTIREEERDAVQETVNAAIAAKKSFSVNYSVLHSDGSTRHILNQGEVIYNEHKMPDIMLGAVQDVTELKLAEEEIKFLAFYDGLTGLANRMLFLNRLEQEIAKAQRNDEMVALLYLDLDQFKNVNDTFGHHFGDLLLKKVSEALQHCIRKTDIASRVHGPEDNAVIARLGGDEFTILLSEIKEPEHAAIVARRILQEVNKPYNLEGQEITITTSIGISLYPADGVDSNVLLKHADTAMYQAKNQGRNNYQFYVKSLNAAVVERFSIERSIPKAFEREEFTLYFQPKIALGDQKIVGAEALIRWEHPELGFVPPSRFISIAEESGHIIAINKWVLEKACDYWQRWISQGLNPGVLGVNLSGYQFAKQQLPQHLQERLNNVGLDPANLEIEITENILMQDTNETLMILEQLREMGVRIAVDDFGTGYSSLGYLTSFPVDTLKIDRSFVMGCAKDKKNHIIIKAIIAMGHSLGMKIVAEGVEEKEELEIVTGLGADEAQGYYFARPLPSAEFIELLR